MLIWRFPQQNKEMRLKLPDIKIDAKSPYENDLFDREPYGEALFNLVARSEGSFTMSIDGQWGDGKTTFAKMWLNHLRNEGVRASYFDAFAQDHGDDPFIPLASNVIETLTPLDVADRDSREDLYKKAAGVGLKILKLGGRVGVRVATAGLVGDSEIAAAEGVIAETLSDASDSAFDSYKDFLDRYRLEPSEVDGFRAALRTVVELGDEDSPVVIIIDELDRCRPTYAIALFEKIKHFFSVPNIVFVFVMNSRQMTAAIERMYGSGIDAHQYLHKFVDVETRLPSKESNYRGPSHYKVYCSHLLNQLQIESYGDATDLHEIMPDLAAAFDMSLRDIEKACRNIQLFYASLSERQLHISSIIALIAVLKVADTETYDTIKTGGAPRMSVIESLRGSTNLDYVRSWFLACLGNDELVDEGGKDFISHAIQMERSVNLKRTKFLEYHCAKMDYFA